MKSAAANGLKTDVLESAREVASRGPERKEQGNVTRPRILYLAWTVPGPQSGACLAMQRHFIDHDDFEFFVVSDSPFDHPGHGNILLRTHRGVARVRRTRLSRLVRQFEMLFLPRRMAGHLDKVVQEFAPDAIFTIPDNTVSWAAYLLAKKHRLPLISNFQDWWPEGQFVYRFETPYPFVRGILEARFRKIYEESALAFCTSEGMRDHLGPHRNAAVLYPCPARLSNQAKPDFQPPAPEQPLRLLYAGAIVNAYGRSIKQLATQIRPRDDLQFHLYGATPDWPTEEVEQFRQQGVYHGRLPYAELVAKYREAGAFLVVMSFEPRLRKMMETSFTTKFLEYCQQGKPVIVWGPSYCQPVQLAQREGSAITVTEPDPAAVVRALESLRDPAVWIKYAKAARQAADSTFSHDRIHGVFREKIMALLGRGPEPS
jgi:hypothetical protein